MFLCVRRILRESGRFGDSPHLPIAKTRFMPGACPCPLLDQFSPATVRYLRTTSTATGSSDTYVYHLGQEHVTKTIVF